MKTTSRNKREWPAGWFCGVWDYWRWRFPPVIRELDVQQQYPFTVETMPVPKQLAKGETAECAVKWRRKEIDRNSLYRGYLQYDGTGFLKLENGMVFKPNDRYLLEDAKFRLYYTSRCDEAQNLVVVVENNWGDLVEMEFDFNHADEESENEPKSSQPDKE